MATFYRCMTTFFVADLGRDPGAPFSLFFTEGRKAGRAAQATPSPLSSKSGSATDLYLKWIFARSHCLSFSAFTTMNPSARSYLT